MNPPKLPEPPHPLSDRRLLAIIFSIAVVTAAADYLFWWREPGVSWSIFAGLLMLMILVHGQRRWSLAPMSVAGLLCGAIAQSAIEVSFSNILVTLALLFALMGEVFYPQLNAGWARWSEAAWSFAKTPARWLRLLATTSRWRGEAAGAASFSVRRGAHLLRICLPALVLTVVFGIILGSGNAIFGQWLNHAFAAFFQWLTDFDITVGRVFFWGLIASIALPFVLPGRAPAHSRWWTGIISTLPEPREPAIRQWQARLVLLLLNILFFAVNTINAVYLWIHSALPADVSYSSFVHRGVFLLVVAVLLSALVLVVIFQQAAVVTRGRGMRSLALLWIVQNVVLVSSVLLRLKLYVDAYQLSTLRIYVAFFLLLVTTGFVLLAMHVWRRRTLNWLIFTNVLATFTLFYIVQFLDVAQWVAQYNLTQWKADRTRTLDLQYLVNLGPSAWPALLELSHFSVAADEVQSKLSALREKESLYLTSLDWRSWQARHVRYARLVTAK